MVGGGGGGGRAAWFYVYRHSTMEGYILFCSVGVQPPRV